MLLSLSQPPHHPPPSLARPLSSLSFFLSIRYGLTPNPKIFGNLYSACGSPVQRTGLDYKWVPDGSSMVGRANESACGSTAAYEATWSPERMCQALRGRTIIFCGDGIQTSVYETLATVLGAPGGGGCQAFGQGCANSACSGQVKMKHIEVVHCLSSQVLPILEQHPNAIFVTNRGHHYRNTPQVTDDIALQLSLLKSKAPNVTWIWRNHNMFVPQQSLLLCVRSCVWVCICLPECVAARACSRTCIFSFGSRFYSLFPSKSGFMAAMQPPSNTKAL